MTESRPKSVWALLVILAFLAVNALGGGWSLMRDASGARLSMTTDILSGSPFTNFGIPGTFLFIVLGICPLVVIFGIFRRSYWSWPGSLAIGIILILWLGVQASIVGFFYLQAVFLFVALVILWLAAMPATREYFNIKTLPESKA